VNRHSLAALARGIVCASLGLLPFVALGHFVSWWIAGAAVIAGTAGAAVWWLRSPWRWLR
jgi:hypothetical protein